MFKFFKEKASKEPIATSAIIAGVVGTATYLGIKYLNKLVKKYNDSYSGCSGICHNVQMKGGRGAILDLGNKS